MNTPLGSRRPELPAIRLDPEPLDRGWREPSRAGRPWPGSQKFLVVVAVLLLLGGGIWSAGGFGRRGDRLRTYAAGQLVDAGPMTITMDRVEIAFTPKREYDEDDVAKWTITGYGRATSTESRPVVIGRDIGILLIEDGRRFKASLSTGDNTDSRTRSSGLEPGLNDLPVTVEGTIPAADWNPTGMLRVGLWRLEYAAHHLDQADTRKSWGAGSERITFWCPVTRLPDEKFG